MNTFKTPKGTELPFISLKGKDYLQVSHRLIWFREERPDWGIETQIITMTDKMCLSKATIKDPSGRIIADGYKQESAHDFGDFIEKSLTGAIGRALAVLGYGTQFAQELDEGERIVDSPIPPKSGAKGIVTLPKPPAGPVRRPSDAQMKRLYAIAISKKITDEQIHQYIAKHYQLTSLKDLNLDQYNELCAKMEGGQDVQVNKAPAIRVEDTMPDMPAYLSEIPGPSFEGWLHHEGDVK